MTTARWTPRNEREYRRRVAHAYARVPFYRETWIDTGPAAPSVVDVAELAHHDRFLPLGGSSSEADPQPYAATELYEVLLATETYRDATTVFEIRRSLRDWDRLGPHGRAPYRVLLSADADTDPFTTGDLRRETLTDFAATPDRVLLGDTEQLRALDGVATETDHATAFTRIALGDPVPARGVLYDERLGYIGATASCGRLHINQRRFHAVTVTGAVVFTKFVPTRPTLVHIRLPGADRVGLGQCAEHDCPVLLGRLLKDPV